MNWYTLFRQHILDRGMEYYEEGHVVDFSYYEDEIVAQVDGTDVYDVRIMLEGEDVIDMYCSCPYAGDGYNCKHMAAVLFKFEEVLSAADMAPNETIGDMTLGADLFARHHQKKAEVVKLVSKIPEDKVREMLVGFIMADESLKHNLEMQYDFKMTSKMMLELRTEVDQIVYRNSRGGFVDWYHASEFTSELEGFLDTKVKALIGKDCLKQAFELTNLVFHCIGNIDMDDSDGGSSFVANNCYECWKQIAETSDDVFKSEMKKWFETHRDGYVIDFMEEYIDEILMDVFATPEMIAEEIRTLDEFIDRHEGNDCGRLYSVHYGYENPVLKRIEYMKKLQCTDKQIMQYREQNRRFFVIRELEVIEAIEESDYKTAINVLLESKKLDESNQEQLKKYSEQLIDIYEKTGANIECNHELKYYLESFWQYDLIYFNLMKSSISEQKQWNTIVDEIVTKNRFEDFVCKVLHEEKRYEQLMDKIERSSNKVGLLDIYEKTLRKKMPERIIKIYSDYLEKAAEMANDRKKYKYLMPYLKKISKCSGGDVVARDIANGWKCEYKRRTAMMDELRKAGF